MNADQDRDPLQSELTRLQLDEMTRAIIGCVYTVANSLGSGFLEKVYENALAHELRKQGLLVEQQRPIPVFYDGVAVGDYSADLLSGTCCAS
jgi:GxxExxY protein